MEYKCDRCGDDLSYILNASEVSIRDIQSVDKTTCVKEYSPHMGHCYDLCLKCSNLLFYMIRDEIKNPKMEDYPEWTN